MIDISGAGAIEVMRSNASSIYGNASGGVINVMSNTMFASPFASYTESFGSFGFHKEIVNAGAMLSSGKMYLSLSNTTFDGWREHSNSAQTLLNTGVAASLGERTYLGVHVSATSNIFRIPGALTQAQYDANPQQGQNDTSVYLPTYVARDERRYNRLGRIGITASHELDDNNMISASAFVQPKLLQRSERNQFREFNRYHVGGSAIYKNRARFSPEVQNTLLIGADDAYQDGAIAFYNRYNIPSLPTTERGTLRDNKREGANNLGAFVQDEISVSDKWLALVGARYDNITYNYESYFDPTIIPVKRSFKRVTPKAGITYRLSPTHSVYANLGGGVEVPAGNETDPEPGTPYAALAINPLLEPVTSTTIEVGTKQLAILGGDAPFAHLTYDIAAYWLQVRNDIVPYSSGTLFFTAGKTQRMGLEVGGTIQFTMGLSLNAALTASSNEYKEYLVDSVHYGKPGKLANYADNKVVGIPDIFYTLGAKYMPGALKGAYVRLGIQSVGKYFVNDANTITVPSYTILNGEVGIEHLNFANGVLYLSAFAGLNNLTDARYIASAWLNPDLGRTNKQPAFIEPGLPSNFVGSLMLGVNL
jgi:iron complex outermembrane receptor protein